MNPATHRQQVLFLWLENSNLDGRVVAWTFHDGTGVDADLPNSPPYRRGVDALLDGWRLIQASPILPAHPGAEFTTGPLKYEFVFERIVLHPHD